MDVLRTLAVATGAALLCIPAAAPAQARADRLVAGAQVRFHTRMYDAGFWNTGRVDSASTDSVYIVSPSWGMKSLGVARSDFTRLDVGTGHASRGGSIARSAGIGALTGGRVGAVAGYASGSDRNCEFLDFACFTAGQKAGILGGAGLITGAALGAVVGAIRPLATHWTTVLPPSARSSNP